MPLLLLLPVTLALAARLAPGPLTVDDAYIIFRYARNIAEGAGYVYNPGQWVLGTTAPLYTLLLAGLAAIGLEDLPRVAWALNAMLDAASAALLYLGTARVAGRLAGLLAGSLFALAPMSIAYSAGGMETSFFVFLLGSSFWAAICNRINVAVAAVALGTLTRPEAVILVGLLLLGLALQQRRIPIRPAILYAAILAPWVAFASWQFGSPLPQSMTAKAVVYTVNPVANPAALVLHAGMPAQSVFLLGGSAPLPQALALAATLLLPVQVALAYGGARRLVAHDRLLLPWVLFPVVYVLAYAVAGFRGVRMFPWYLAPLTPFYLVLLTSGIPPLAKAVRARFGGGDRAVVAAAAGLLALWWVPGLVSAERVGYPVGFSTERERAYRELATDYSSEWGSGTVVAAPEIGAIGYYIRGEILDTAGLVTPRATAYYPLPPQLLASDNAVAPRLIQDLRPHYLASLDQFVRLSLLPDPWFATHYELIESRAVAVFESRQLLVFRRRDT